MKTLRSVSVLFGAAILVIAVSAGQASAGGIYGWGSAGCCGDSVGDGYGGGYGQGGVYGGYIGPPTWGYGGLARGGYVGWGPGGCGLYSPYWIVGDYDAFIIGHGPMFPAGDSPRGAYWYGGPPEPETPAAPKRK
jgi:hypothetical protein